MVEQLTLRLDPIRPRLPASLRPMLPQAADAPFDSPDHLFEPVWGGLRVLALLEAGGADRRPPVRLLDPDGRDLAPLLPELAGLADRIGAESAVLDGEIVVVDRLGRADRLALAARLRGQPGPPVAYLVSDLLYRDGRPLLNVALERRRQALRRLLRPADDAIAVPAIAGEGRALYEAVVEAGIAGVMGRVRRSPYLPGVRSRLWQFIARREAGAGDPTDVTPPDAEPDAAGPADSRESSDDSTTDRARSGPVLALIRRLPLDDVD